MWADNDSDDERPRFGGGGNRKNNLAMPMNFVSGGIKQGDKTYKPGEEVEYFLLQLSKSFSCYSG